MPIDPIIGQLGGTALGAGMGLILQKGQDKRQIKQQQKLQDMQIAGQKQMGIFNREQQMQLWNDTNYAAQVAQMKKAGLSPGLIYGHSGQGGTTAAQPGNISGADAPKGGGEAMGMGIQMGQAAMIAAQIELTRAQTEKTKAEAQNVPKTGENIEASTANLLQGVQNAKAQEILTTIQGEIAEIQRNIDATTMNARVSQILTQTKILANEENIGTATVQDKIKQIKAEAVEAVLQNWLTKAETQNVKAQTEVHKQQPELILQQRRNLIAAIRQGDRALEIQALKSFWDNAEARGLYDDDAKGIKEMIDNILVVPTIGKGGSPKPVTGFKTNK